MSATMQFNQRPVPTFNEGTLKLLVSAYSGSAKEELYACTQYSDPTEGYEQAWLVLDERHGDRRKYIRHLVRKAMNGPNLNLEDIEGLRAFRNDLGMCVRNLKRMGALKHIEAYEVLGAMTPFIHIVTQE
ncbi:hypothetical protein E2C01_037880 [Portunus trituberculatus]|uniref:Uncharacterized protein n=1 Tax=Portunus trituberculatus TaxID=210409 RepID=A0A5B7FID5_PORTR|nr:hypothetical protein [Portunus trituberculatus]